MRLFDSHAHIASDRFAGDLPDVLMRMREAGVAACVVVCDPGDDEPDHERALEIVRQTPVSRLAAGVPAQRPQLVGRDGKTLRGLWALAECAVLGEIGLDYHYDLSPRDAQQREVFERQLDLALELDMPVQLHIREAHGEAMELMQRRHKSRPRCRAASCTAFPAAGNWPKFTSHLDTIYRSPAW